MKATLLEALVWSTLKKLLIGCVGVLVALGQAIPSEAQQRDTGQPGNGKLKVFLLAGQSNMQGHGVIQSNPDRNGGKGSLEYLVKNEKTRAQFSHLVDQDGHWKSRKDVWIWYLDRKGELTTGYGANEKLIGPELQFGHVVGDYFDDQVLLIKTAWGGKSVAVDFRSPGSGKIGPEFSEQFIEQLKEKPETVGFYYREMLRHFRGVLKGLKTDFPSYDGKGYEVVGVGWHQGWNDRVNQSFNDHYKENLARMIKDLRKDLQLPLLPFVIAETGMSGVNETHPRAVSLMKAQAAVAKMPEFVGNVSFVPTRTYFRPKEESPSGQSYHWNTNAQTYFLIGDGMGKAMIKLVQ